MKTLSLLFGLFFINLSASPQNNNSDLNTLREQYAEGHQQGDSALVQKATEACRNLISIYERTNDRRGLAKAYTLLGQILVEGDGYEEAKEVLSKALDLSNKEFKADSEEVLEAKRYLSWAYGYSGDLDAELKYSMELLETYKKEEKKNILQIADLYNTIGQNYGLRDDREKEREYLFKSQQMLEVYKPKNENEITEVQSQLMNLFNSLSQSYISSIDFKNGALYARKSLKISELLYPNAPPRAATLVALGRCIYTLEKKCDSANYYLDKALSILELNKLEGSTMWLNYRSYKVNILVRCGNINKAKSEARITINTMLNKGVSSEEALSQLLVLSQNTNAELTTMDNQYKERETIASQKRTKERNLFIVSIIIIILISTIIFIGYKIRQNKKEIEFQKKENKLQNDLLHQGNEMRQRIYCDLHDEIGSGLTQITMICTKGKNNIKRELPAEPSFNSVIQESIMLNKSLTDIIWATNPNHDNIKSLVSKIRECANEFAENSGIELQLKIPNDDNDFPTRPEANRNIHLILKEGLTNIAKHSNASKTEIVFTVDVEKNFALTITDNGKGFNTAAPTSRNGKEVLKKRAASLKNGKLELISEIGKGTTLMVTGNLS